MAHKLTPLDEQANAMLVEARVILNDIRYRHRNHSYRRRERDTLEYFKNLLDYTERYRGISQTARERLPIELQDYRALVEQNQQYPTGFRQSVMNTLDELLTVAEGSRERRKELFGDAGTVVYNFHSYLKGTRDELADLKDSVYLDEQTLRLAIRLAYLLKLVGEPTEQITLKLQEFYTVTGNRSAHFSPTDPIDYVLSGIKIAAEIDPARE